MKLFEGQKVHLEATVRYPNPDCDGEIGVEIKGERSECFVVYIRAPSIIHAEPAPLAVGDLVTWGNGLNNYTILHIDDGVAFLKSTEASRHATHDISYLRRAAT